MVKPNNQLSPEAYNKLVALMARDIPKIEAKQAKEKESA